MKDIIIKILGNDLARKLYMLKREYIDGYLNKIYSQEGEDIILSEFFTNRKAGFYVDVGAHHPKRFSNTYLFYKKGWRGINIDAMPGSMKAFRRIRPRDINLELGISGKEGEMTYYMFDEPAINGFSKDISEDRDKNSNFRIIKKEKIRTYPLSVVLEKYLPKDEKISFMSVDVEGLDLMVLRSNNWKKFSPEIVLVECIEESLERIMKDPVFLFLKSKGYGIVAKTYRTVIFMKDK